MAFKNYENMSNSVSYMVYIPILLNTGENAFKKYIRT